MKRILCLLWLLIGLCGCSDREGADSSQIVLPVSEPVVLQLIRPAPEAFEPVEANQIVFDMTYRGLDGPDDDYFFNFGYGYGGNNEDTPFITDLKRHGIKNLHLVYNFEFKGAEVSAVEISRGKALAFYLDLDANGKVTANERITPLPSDTKDRETCFITPDFAFMNRQDQRVCFRALLRVMVNNGAVPYMTWNPACVLEGQTQLGDQPAHLVLYPSGLSGVFDRFIQADASLQIGADQIKAKPSRSDLSQLYSVNDRFYRVQLQRPADHTTALRVVLTEDTSPTGRIKAELILTDNATGTFRYARITGATSEDNISLALPMTSMALPVGRYRLDRGALRYGMDPDRQWEVDFSDGPLMTVAEGGENTVSLGQPTLAVSAIDNQERYRANQQEKTAYERGTQIYLNRKVTGQGGESYGRFQTVKGNQRTDVVAHLAITNPKGKQILSQDLEYG